MSSPWPFTRARSTSSSSRAHEPFAGRWALPGGHVDEGEDLKAAALRELEEEAKVCPAGPTIQVGTFGNPKRDPRGHVISTAFLTIFQDLVGPEAADDAADARWSPLSEAPGLAFDHDFIVELALTKIEMQGDHLCFDVQALIQEEILMRAEDALEVRS